MLQILELLSTCEQEKRRRSLAEIPALPTIDVPNIIGIGDQIRCNTHRYQSLTNTVFILQHLEKQRISLTTTRIDVTLTPNKKLQERL
ncbi:hypothetical protein AM629_08620 [Photorhabdus heterorhabditis]|uniref:Uncharacterized protein n=1 Tax=Photorhabdus heterorhabditis TaxID=880156 RepID=A0ABR5KCU7_9GAMM|nr:hypothetical protein AM629_08620 [Photorhabdus heterorhabditis]